MGGEPIRVRLRMATLNHLNAKGVLKLELSIAVDAWEDVGLTVGKRNRRNSVTAAKGSGLDHNSGSIRPNLIWTRGERLIRTEVCGLDVSKNEVFRWNRTPRQTPQQRELSGVSHGVGKRALQQSFRTPLPECGPEFDVPRDIGKRFMEVGDSGLEVRKFGCPVSSADKESG